MITYDELDMITSDHWRYEGVIGNDRYQRVQYHEKEVLDRETALLASSRKGFSTLVL